jgi:4-diphosphocytidyl-2-C-methyl-D-erythritol kinase
MIREQAPAKVNLVLQVGPRRADGLHEIASLFASLDLADDLRLSGSETGDDLVICEGVDGDNLVATALRLFREQVDADLPPLQVEIEKRIPVAGGMGGGSADAAAVLRAANELAGQPLDVVELRDLAAGIGADVPSQVEPAHALVTGAGELVEPLSLPPMALVLLPSRHGLSTAAVYAEADRLPSTREHLQPDRLRELAAGPLEDLAAALENDLQPAALSLRSNLQEGIDALLAAGALGAGLSGSGPTLFGVFPDPEQAERAAASLDGAIATRLRAS